MPSASGSPESEHGAEIALYAPGGTIAYSAHPLGTALTAAIGSAVGNRAAAVEAA